MTAEDRHRCAVKFLRRLKAFIEADAGAPVASWQFWCPVAVDRGEDEDGAYYRYTIRLNFYGLLVPILGSLGYVVLTKELL